MTDNVHSSVFGAASVDALHVTSKEFNRQSAEHTAKLVQFTKAIIWLTVAMLIAVILQIVISVPPLVVALRAL